MRGSNKIFIAYIVIAFLFGLAIGFSVGSAWIKESAVDSVNVVSLTGNTTLTGISSISNYKPVVLGAIMRGNGGEGWEETLKGLEYETKIRCLVKHESGGRERVVGDKGESYGVLQYNKWWEAGSLWQVKCVRDYGFPDDIKNPEYQILCANELFKENFDLYFRRWSTYKYCI